MDCATAAAEEKAQKMQNKEIRWEGLARGMRKSISRRGYAGPDEELTLEKTPGMVGDSERVGVTRVPHAPAGSGAPPAGILKADVTDRAKKPKFPHWENAQHPCSAAPHSSEWAVSS